MVWLPAVSVDVVNVATPAANATAPSGVLPSLNVTVPVGGPPDPVTVVVKVMAWAKPAGLCDDVSPTDVGVSPTERLKFAVAVALLASVTVTVKVVVASTTVGVPVMVPVAVLKLRPAGSVGATLNVSGAVPPLPVTGVNGVAAWLMISAVDGTAVVAVTAPFTVRLNVLVAVAPLASVTVTVKVVAAIAAVGVPLTAPFEVLKLRPAGRLGATPKDSGAVPPAPVTGVNVVAA